MNAVFLIAACTLLEIQSAECRTACKYEGYDGGFFQKAQCICVDKYIHSDLMEKKTLKHSFLPASQSEP